MVVGTIVSIEKDFGMQPKKDGGEFGPAMLAVFELESGEEIKTWVWEEKPIGEELELEQNGKYWNVAKKRGGGIDLSEITRRLDAIDKKLDKLLTVGSSGKSGLEFAREKARSIKSEAPDIEDIPDEYR